VYFEYQNLLRDEASVFFNMVQETGAQNAALLHATALETERRQQLALAPTVAE
jgi:hypothetical protein